MDLTFATASEAADLDLGASPWLTIDQGRIDRFADVTEDHQWIHTDPERAAASPFGTTIAHGYLLLSMVPEMFSHLLHVTDASMMVNYGLDRLRFVHPVPAGSEIRLKATLVTSTPRGDKLLLRVRGEIEGRARDGDEPKRAVVLDTLFLAAPPVG